MNKVLLTGTLTGHELKTAESGLQVYSGTIGMVEKWIAADKTEKRKEIEVRLTAFRDAATKFNAIPDGRNVIVEGKLLNGKNKDGSIGSAYVMIDSMEIL